MPKILDSMDLDIDKREQISFIQPLKIIHSM